MTNIAGLYTALSGMNAQRRVLDVTAHNIANQTTEGFHRQRVELKAAGIGSAARVFAGQGSQLRGVDVVAVTRIVDQLAENRWVLETARSAGAETTSAELNRIELAFPEPSDTGLASLLDDFWAGWSDLSMYPAETATRVQTLERGQSLVDGLRRAAGDLDQVANTASMALSTLAQEVNDIARRIADLNSGIATGGLASNDLADQRDVLLRELAGLTGAVAHPGDGGVVNVSIGGRELVSGVVTQRVQAVGGVFSWQRDGLAVAAPTSRAASLVSAVHDVVPRYRAALDGVAASLVTEVNALHVDGFDQSGASGWTFFDPAGVTASTISLSSDVAGRPDRLAAGAPVLPGPTAPGAFDGDQARAIASIADRTVGPDADYRAMVSKLGIEVRTARRGAEIQSGLTQAAEVRAASTGGVSIDEEMVTLMASQRAYEASARVLTTVDELMDVLMRTGMVGR
jgi:flagellar hook-associated protein 1 FlgK